MWFLQEVFESLGLILSDNVMSLRTLNEHSLSLSVTRYYVADILCLYRLKLQEAPRDPKGLVLFKREVSDVFLYWHLLIPTFPGVA